jgi:2-dehydropantoate 2-reductase
LGIPARAVTGLIAALMISLLQSMARAFGCSCVSSPAPVRRLTSASACDVPSGDHAATLVALLTGAGLEAEVHPDVRAMLWSKLIVNAAINPVTALAGVPNGALLERDDLHRKAHAVAREGEAVAAALEIALDYADACRRVDEVCTATATNRSSMLQDLERGRATEIDCINGAIVRAGLEAEIPTPVNRNLLAEIVSSV